MNINSSDYRVTSNIRLSDYNTHQDFGLEKDKLELLLEKVRTQLGRLQDTMYAHDKYAVLICLQGMDTSGKDSLIREVFKDFNSRGVEVHSFKVPTDAELDHDYLWRHYIALPPRGIFGIHNRTHYENVLVTRVHPEYIMGERLPKVTSVEHVDEAFWDRRFEQINNFEQHLVDNGTLVFKFYLNLSKEEQKNRLLRRLRKKEKNWKFSAGDLKERRLWDRYMECYQDAINRTSKKNAPWFVIPADSKPAARLIVAKILLEAMQEYTNIKEPALDPKIQAKLAEYIQELNNE
jgi:PPK2 family polyphosphate:nucleotide phosphotransferase